MYKFFLLLGLCSTLFASADFEGFYLGGSLGGSIIRGMQSGENVSTVGVPGNVMVLTEDLKVDLFNAAVDASLYAGYSRFSGPIFYGLEGFLRFSKNDFDIDLVSGAVVTDGGVIEFFLNDIHSQIEIGPWHVGLDGRLGFLLTPSTLLYGRLGLEYSKVRLSRKVDFNGFDVTPFALVFSKSKRENFPHVRFGLGLEKKLSPAFSLRADYIYTLYRTISLSGEISDLQSGVPVSIQDAATIKPRNHTATLGLSYYFPCSPSCLYAECFCPEFSGFYLSGSLGGAILDNRFKGTHAGIVVFPSTQVATFPIKLPRHVARNSVLLNLGFGYGWQWKKAYAGIEAFIEYANLWRRREDANHFLKVGVEFFETVFHGFAKIDPWQFGIDLRPGFFITSGSLFYGILGTSIGRISFKSSGTGDFEDTSTFNLHTSLDLAKSSIRASLRLGLGLEYAILPSCHLRAEYAFTNYGKLTLQGSAIVIQAQPPSSGTLVHQSAVRFHTHALTLGITKYF